MYKTDTDQVIRISSFWVFWVTMTIKNNATSIRRSNIYVITGINEVKKWPCHFFSEKSHFHAVKLCRIGYQTQNLFFGEIRRRLFSDDIQCIRKYCEFKL
ncbi:hypothetical protein D3C85_1388510 [compost metagenome]